jgi:hypothetical protein
LDASTNPRAPHSALFDYIEAFYNPERTQRRLSHHNSPATYEKITTVA